MSGSYYLLVSARGLEGWLSGEEAKIEDWKGKWKMMNRIE